MFEQVVWNRTLWSSQDSASNSSQPVRKKNDINFTPGMSGKAREKPLWCCLNTHTLSSGEVDMLTFSVALAGAQELVPWKEKGKGKALALICEYC